MSVRTSIFLIPPPEVFRLKQSIQTSSRGQEVWMLVRGVLPYGSTVFHRVHLLLLYTLSKLSKK